MLKKTIKSTIKFASYVFIALFFFISAVFLWIATGPRTVPFLADYISTSMTEMLPDTISLSINTVEVGLDDSFKIEFRLVDLKFFDINKGEIATDNIVIKLDPIALFPQTHHNLLNIQIAKPTISYAQLPIAETSNALPISAINEYINKHQKSLLKFSLSFTDTEFAIDITDEKKAKIRINDLTIRPDLKKDKLVFLIYGDISINQKNSVFEASIDTSSNKNLTIKGTASKLSNISLQEFGLNLPELSNSNIDFDVGFMALIRGSRAIDYIEFDVNNVYGVVKANEFINKDVKLEKFSLHGYCNNNCNEINIEKLKVKAGNIQFFSNLEYKSIAGQPHVLAHFTLGQASIHDIEDLWPKKAMSRTRDWIFEHISKGTLRSAKGVISLNLAEVAAKKLDKSNIEVLISLEDTDIAYLDYIEPVRNVSAVVKITPDLITFDATKGTLGNITINKAHGDLRELTSSKSRMEVTAQASGDLQRMIDLTFQHAEKDNKTLKNFTGTATANIALKFPIRDEDLTIKDLDILVSAEATKVANPQVYKEFGFKDGHFDIHFENFIATVKGTALMNNKVPVTVDVLENIFQDKRTIKIKSRLNWDDLTAFNLTKPDFISNHFTATLQLNEVKGVEEMALNLDVTDSTVNYPRLNLKKKISEPGFVRLMLKESKDKIVVDDYYVSLPMLDSKGSLVMDKNYNVTKATSGLTKFKNGEFAFTLEGNANKKITITGKSFDASDLPLLDKSKQSTNSNPASNQLTNLDVSLHVNKLFLKDSVSLHNVAGTLSMKNDIIDELKLNGAFADASKLNVNMKYPIFSISSNNGGNFFKGFGLSSKINGGSLNIHGKMEGKNYQGTVEMLDYKVKKTSILMKLISVVSILSTSLDGLTNLFDQDGMSFRKLKCPFSLESNTLSLNNCLAQGPSLNIAAKGTINLNTDQIDVKGTVAAQGLLNTVVKSIPLVGDLLVGRKDQGLIGASYSISGSIDDPEISSNPLSILAPGIFKDAF